VKAIFVGAIPSPST